MGQYDKKSWKETRNKYIGNPVGFKGLKQVNGWIVFVIHGWNKV